MNQPTPVAVSVTSAIGHLADVLDSQLNPYILVAPVVDPDTDGEPRDFSYVFVNEAACAYLRRSPDELVGHGILELFPSPNAEALVSWCKRAAATGDRVVVDESEWTSAVGGQVLWLDLQAVPIGDLVGVTWRDDAERHATRVALARSEEQYRLLAENATDIIIRTSADHTIAWVSPSVREVLGWQPEDLIGSRVPDFMHPADLNTLMSRMRGIRASGSDNGAFESRFRTAAGGWRWMSGVGRALKNPDGETVGGIDSLRDVQAQHDAAVRLSDSEAHFRLLAEHSSDVVLRLTADGRIAWASPSIERLLGGPSRQWLSRSLIDIAHASDRDDVARGLAASRTARERIIVTFRIADADLTYTWVEATMQQLNDSGSGKNVGQGKVMVVRLRDVDTQVKTLRDLTQSERRFRTALHSAPIGMAVGDLAGSLTEANPALCLMLGRSAEWLQSNPVSDVIHADDVGTWESMRDDLIAGRNDSLTGEFRLVTATGEVRWAQCALAIVRDDDWSPVMFVAQILDITEARQAHTVLQFLADQDPLTDTRNRRAFLALLASALEKSSTEAPLGLLFIDLDGLKPVNDRYGHASGDVLLAAVARRVGRSLRPEDVIGRMGGDEFAVLLNPCFGPACAETIAQRILESVREPLPLEGTVIEPSISIGAAMGMRGEAPESLLRRADIALYRAKRAGGGRVDSEP